MYDLFGVDAIVGKTGYSYAYVVNIMNGAHEPNARFRRLCALHLGKPEAELFGPQEEADANAQG